jgi:6-phosphogluconolactonase
METIVFRDPEQMSRAAAELITREAHKAVKQFGRFTMALSGGRTPAITYRLLGGDPGSLPWKNTHFFWGDERCVPPDDERSNFKLARETLFLKNPIPENNIHRMPGEILPPEKAALYYEQDLITFFGPGRPAIDLILLGMGADGHTASLFPGSPALKAGRELVTAVVPPPGIKPAVPRLTMILPVINAARNVLFLVTGSEKRQPFEDILRNYNQGDHDYPAAHVHPKGKLIRYIDQAAAGESLIS